MESSQRQKKRRHDDDQEQWQEQQHDDNENPFASLESMLNQEDERDCVESNKYEPSKQANLGQPDNGFDHLGPANTVAINTTTIDATDSATRSNQHGPAHSSFGNSIDPHNPQHASREDESQDILEKSRRAMERLKNNKKKKRRSAAPISFASQMSAPPANNLEDGEYREKKKKEFISSNRGMMIPKHWGKSNEQVTQARKRAATRRKKASPPAEKNEASKSHQDGASTVQKAAPAPTKRRSKFRESAVCASFSNHSTSRTGDNRGSGMAPVSATGDESNNKRAISFAPSFASKTTAPIDPLVEDRADPQGAPAVPATTTAPSPADAWWLSTPSNQPKKPRKRWSGSSLGLRKRKRKWSMQFKKVRDGIQGDALRLRTSVCGGTFAPSNDPMHPRNTALSRSVITVVSDNAAPWTPGSPDGFTALVYLHEHKKLGKKRISRNDHADDEDDGMQGLAWCLLTPQSFRERACAKGVQMVLYNALVFETSNHPQNPGDINYTIISTQLSESYPPSAPSLPTLEDLPIEEAMKSNSATC